MKFTWEITKAWLLQVREKLIEKLQNGKNPRNERIINGIKIKWRKAWENWKEERKKAIERKITKDREVHLEASAKWGTKRTGDLVSFLGTCISNSLSTKSHTLEPRHILSECLKLEKSLNKFSYTMFFRISKQDPKITSSTNAHDWGYRWGRHSQRSDKVKFSCQEKSQDIIKIKFLVSPSDIKRRESFCPQRATRIKQWK